MALCSVDDVRAYYSPVKITNVDIAAIIGVATTSVLTDAGTTDETNAYLIQAGIHLSVATTMKRARSNGELASSVETPEYKQQNAGLDVEIKGHEEAVKVYIEKYKKSVSASSGNYSFGSGRIGYGTVNADL